MNGNRTAGVIPIIMQVTDDLHEIISELEVVEAGSEQKHLEHLEILKRKLVNSLNKLRGLFIKVYKTSRLVSGVINTINSSRTELRKSVEGLIKKTGVQLQKVSSTTEDATNKIMDIAESLDDDQEKIIKKIEGLSEKFSLSESEEIEELKQMIYANQDKAFTIMDFLQFQDITAQQIAGAYGMLADVEKTLVYVSDILKDFDDVGQEESLKKNKYADDVSFNADAKFEDKENVQSAIDNLFTSGDVDTQFPTNLNQQEETKPPPVATTPQASEEVDIDALFATGASASETKSDEVDIDALFAGGNQSKPEGKKEEEVDIDALFATGNQTKEVQESQDDETEVDIDALFATEKKDKSSQDDIDKLFENN